MYRAILAVTYRSDYFESTCSNRTVHNSGAFKDKRIVDNRFLDRLTFDPSDYPKTYLHLGRLLLSVISSEANFSVARNSP